MNIQIIQTGSSWHFNPQEKIRTVRLITPRILPGVSRDTVNVFGIETPLDTKKKVFTEGDNTLKDLLTETFKPSTTEFAVINHSINIPFYGLSPGQIVLILEDIKKDWEDSSGSIIDFVKTLRDKEASSGYQTMEPKEGYVNVTDELRMIYLTESLQVGSIALQRHAQWHISKKEIAVKGFSIMVAYSALS